VANLDAIDKIIIIIMFPDFFLMLPKINKKVSRKAKIFQQLG